MNTDTSYMWSWGQKESDLDTEIWADYARDLDQRQPRCVKMGGILPISIMSAAELRAYVETPGENRERTIIVAFDLVGQEPIKTWTGGSKVVDILYLTVDNFGWELDPPSFDHGPLTALDAKRVTLFVSKHICQEDFDRLIIQGETAWGTIPAHRPNPYTFQVETVMEGGDRGKSRAAAVAAALVRYFGYSPRYYFLDGETPTVNVSAYLQMLCALSNVYFQPPGERMPPIEAQTVFSRYWREIEAGERPPVRATW